MFLYVVLYILHAYLILFTALLNAVCLYNAYLFFAIDFCKCFLFSCFVFGLLKQLVYLKCYFLSCAALLICWFSKFYACTVF